jgi:hypothetical protein
VQQASNGSSNKMRDSADWGDRRRLRRRTGKGEGPDELARDLVAVADPEALALAAVLETARGYAEDAKAYNTRQAYRSDWRAFEGWCQADG